MTALDEKWSQCLEFIHDNIEESCYEAWFATLVPYSFKDNMLQLSVPSSFIYEKLENTYADLMRSALLRVFGQGVTLSYRVSIDSQNKKTGSINLGASQQPTNKKNVSDFNSHLISNYRFENFVEGICNKLPRTAGLNIASQPGKQTFNPLLIYGKSGVGKTHLANAIGFKTKELHPQKKVLYVSANLFMLQYTEASRNNQVNNFLQFYQNVDMLIIDDIQEFGEGKRTSTQNTFFHIFNHLHQSGKQLIMTCDKKPAELEGLEERLLTRFKWGLSAEIESPDLETRKQILRALINKDGLQIGEDVVDYIAENVTDNIRNLEGSLVSLMAQSTINQKSINISLAKQVVSNIVPLVEKKISTQGIRDTVCEYFHISNDDLASPSRKREVVQARQIAMYLAKTHTKDSLNTIGAAIGRRNHATVLHACKTVQDLMDTDKSFRYSMDEIERKITE